MFKHSLFKTTQRFCYAKNHVRKFSSQNKCVDTGSKTGMICGAIFGIISGCNTTPKIHLQYNSLTFEDVFLALSLSLSSGVMYGIVGLVKPVWMYGIIGFHIIGITFHTMHPKYNYSISQP